MGIEEATGDRIPAAAALRRERAFHSAQAPGTHAGPIYSMAQPSELSQSRPQSEHLDSSSVELHASPGKEQQGHYQQQPALQLEETPQPAYPGDASTGKSCTHPVGNGARHISAGGDDEGTLNGGSTTANAHLNNRAPIVGPPADWIEDPYGGRQETRYDGDTPLLTSPAMSNAQPPQGPPRHPVSYPSPTSYPPAGMPPVAHYAFPPQPPTDPYRQTPTALPSMRTLEQQQHPQPHAIPMGAHMTGPMGPAPPMGYYGVPPHAYNIHADPNAMRFAMAPGMADPRIALSGGRHKKEIKRRTKTGCLTCRKRRIKCDEAHPTCNNCKKSKRECLGYDPIFKQQQGPTAIQPAPNSQTAAPISTLASTPTLQSSTAHTYQTQPPVVPSSYPPSVPSSITFDSPVSSTAQSVKTEPGFDYSAAIDPALQGADLSTGPDTPPSQYRQTKLEGREEVAKHYSKAKKMRVDELLALGGVAPPTPSSPPSANVLDEITKLYNEIYVRGLSLFFESEWYEPKESRADDSGPIAAIHRNQQLITLFASFIQTLGDVKNSDPTDMVYSSHLEASLVWALARLPASALPTNVPLGLGGTIPVEGGALEAWNRVNVFEALVSGDTLPANPLSSLPTSDISIARKHELEFWYYLAEYLQHSRSSPSPADAGVREHYLGLVRSLLDGRENRDVLYSIAVLREYTARWDAALNEQTVPAHLEESDPRCKLAVATRFIREESASTGGTTNVVRRFADTAYRSFVQPGVNANAGR